MQERKCTRNKCSKAEFLRSLVPLHSDIPISGCRDTWAISWTYGFVGVVFNLIQTTIQKRFCDVMTFGKPIISSGPKECQRALVERYFD